MKKRGKKALSQIIAVTIIIMLAITSAAIVGRLAFGLIKKNGEIIEIKTELLKEDFRIKKVLINESNYSDIKLTVCCATKDVKLTKQEEIKEQQKEIDFSLVIDRSGSMRQSGWTLGLQGGAIPIQEYKNLSVPRNGYSNSNTFSVPPGTERLAVSLNWDRKKGYNGSEGSEFALNLINPSGTWIFGTGRPGVGGIVDPPSDVGQGNEYFSGISTKPQIVYVENPNSGDWEVMVYGWNLRPSTNRPPSQEVNVSVFIGDSSEIIRNPTIISIDAAKDASRNFVNNIRAEDYCNYVVFGSYGELKQSITSNKNNLLLAIDDTGMEGGTAIHTGIQTSSNDLINNGRIDTEKIMILLTDGQNDIGPEIVIQEAENTKSQGIRIFTIGLTGFVDSEMLSAVASNPNDFYYAPDASALQTIFNAIRERIVETYYSELLSQKFLIVFSNKTQTYKEEITSQNIKPLETKTFSFDLQGKISNISKIQIYPVKERENGKEVIGQILQIYEIS